MDDLFAVDEHVEVEATEGIYQQMITVYRQLDRTQGRGLMSKLIESVNHGVPRALTALITLGRTLNSVPPTCWPCRAATGSGPGTAMKC